MFPLGSQTVGIDWAAVSSETTGVDIGVLIGSNLTFGVSEAAMIIDNEKSLRIVRRRNRIHRMDR